jgi:hypothetical protein
MGKSLKWAILTLNPGSVKYEGVLYGNEFQKWKSDLLGSEKLQNGQKSLIEI